jgi:hypothetical protein
MRKAKNKKLSVRERKEAQQMRRMLIIGGSCFGAAAAVGVGATLLDPTFPVLPGEGTINERLAETDIDGHVLDLTPGAPAKSILIIGTTDCTYCRSFVEDGLEKLLAYAKTAGLGVAYAPIGLSSGSLASTRLLSGFSRAEAVPAVILKAVYAAAEELGAGKALPDVASSYGKTLGLKQAAIDEMLAETELAVTSRIQATMRSFPVQGTPMFFVANDQTPERINMFSGWSGFSSLRGRIEAARIA